MILFSLFFPSHFPDSSVGEESSCNAGHPDDSCVGKIPWRRDRLPTPVFLGFPCSSAGKESAGNAGDQGLIPGLGRSPGEGKSYPCQYSSLEKSRDYTVHPSPKDLPGPSDRTHVSVSPSLQVDSLWLSH